MAFINKPKKKTQSFRRSERQKYYQMKQWRELSKWYRMEHPICEICNENVSEQCHHKLSPFDYNIDDETRLSRLLDVENIIAVCRDCHNEIHGNVKKKKNEKNISEN